MTTEKDKTLGAMQIAIQMEIDGKEYYLKASQESSNELGKKLLASLAAEEDEHREKFEEIYDAIRNKKGWPTTNFRRKRLKTIMAMATEELGTNIKAPETELNAIQTAMDMENKTLDFYEMQRENAVYATERDFYENLIVEEREHHSALLDYYEYLKDPADWFAKREHHSLDGS